MGAGPISLWLPWAVHISDGVLTPPWVWGGFALAGLLVLLASYRVRDEEIPRLALLSATFFVSSLMHVRLGPTSVHLLLNGLVGVVLGRRAPLATLIGLALQAALLGHGGFSTLGINTCVLTLPALLAGCMFSGLYRLPWMRRPTTSQRVAHGAANWMLGCVIGMTSVLATLVLNAIVLLWGGAEDWHQIVLVVFLAHLPIVGLEGIVLGFTVSFLARVKPEMIGVSGEALAKWSRPEQPAPAGADAGITRPATEMTPPLSGETEAIQAPLPSRPPALLLVVFASLVAANPAHAHRLAAGFVVLPDQQVQIESWFDPGADPAKGAKVQIFHQDQRLLVEGRLDEQGIFVFRFTETGPLEVIVSAGAGHRTSFVIPREKLEQPADNSKDPDAPPPVKASNGPFVPSDHDVVWREHFKDALIGISFLLAVGAFLLSWRNGQKLKALQRASRTGPHGGA